jgi:hypothetical protein
MTDKEKVELLRDYINQILSITSEFKIEDVLCLMSTIKDIAALAIYETDS